MLNTYSPFCSYVATRRGYWGNGCPWASPTAKFRGRYAAKAVLQLFSFGSLVLISSRRWRSWKWDIHFFIFIFRNINVTLSQQRFEVKNSLRDDRVNLNFIVIDLAQRRRHESSTNRFIERPCRYLCPVPSKDKRLLVDPQCPRFIPDRPKDNVTITAR